MKRPTKKLIRQLFIPTFIDVGENPQESKRTAPLALYHNSGSPQLS